MTDEQFNKANQLKLDISSLVNLKTTFEHWCKCEPLEMEVHLRLSGASGDEKGTPLFNSFLNHDIHMGGVDDECKMKIMESIDACILDKQKQIKEI